MKLELDKLKEMTANSADMTSEARELSERDRDYYDAHQWTAAEVATLNKRKQPVITINRIKRKVDAMVGLEQRGRVDPRAYPRKPQMNEQAETATQALVFVDDNTRFDYKRSSAFENLLVEGYGGVEVIVETVRGQLDVKINRIRWEEIIFDPHSREKDFSDASYVGIMKWMSVDDALSMYSEVYQGEDDLEEILLQGKTGSETGDTYEDRPNESNSFKWVDKKQKRVRVCQMYYRRGGKWYLAIFCGGGEILNVISPYLDEDKNPTNPIILMTGYIDRDNVRYGVVRDMISAQDEINKRRSKLLHQLNSRQTIGVKGALDSVASMKRELAAPDGHVEVNIEAFEDAARVGMKPFELVPNQDHIAGNFSLLQEAKNEIDMVGPNASLLGQQQGQQSGRAIMAQQQGGLAELAPIYDSLRDWTLRVYRAMWERIQQFWTDERWIRITDMDGQTQFVGLNQPVGFDPMNMQPVLENNVAEMDVDIIIEAAPDYVTLQAEQFEQLSDMVAKGIPVPPEMLIEASSLTNKADLLKLMKEQSEQAMQQQQAMMQQQQQQIMMEAQGKAQALEAKAGRDHAAAQKDIATIPKIRSEVMENEADAFKTMVEARRASLGY